MTCEHLRTRGPPGAPKWRAQAEETPSLHKPPSQPESARDPAGGGAPWGVCARGVAYLWDAWPPERREPPKVPLVDHDGTRSRLLCSPPFNISTHDELSAHRTARAFTGAWRQVVDTWLERESMMCCRRSATEPRLGRLEDLRASKPGECTGSPRATTGESRAEHDCARRWTCRAARRSRKMVAVRRHLPHENARRVGISGLCIRLRESGLRRHVSQSAGPARVSEFVLSVLIRSETFGEVEV